MLPKLQYHIDSYYIHKCNQTYYEHQIYRKKLAKSSIDMERY